MDVLLKGVFAAEVSVSYKTDYFYPKKGTFSVAFLPHGKLEAGGK